MNAGLHWAMLDREGTLVALVRSEHFVPLPDICSVTRKAMNLSPTAFLTDKTDFGMTEWYTWLAFGIPAIQIIMEDENPKVPSDITWGRTEIDPEANS